VVSVLAKLARSFSVHPIDTPRKRGTDETTSQSTKPASWQVAGYRDERKMYRTMALLIRPVKV
jgi:hypothetical protein